MSQSTNNFKIALLDSGSGGLGILKELQKRIPYADFQYLCDNLFFPFGEQKSHFIQTRFVNLATDFFHKHKPNLMVIACNTASTLILEELRSRLPIPIVGVVPAVKTASQVSKNSCFGVLATERTIHSSYLESLIEEFASSCHVLKKASPVLVEISEKKVGGAAVDIAALKQELSYFFEQENLDTIVLGCTHFTQLLPDLKSVSPREILFVDSTNAIANRVLSLLSLEPMDSKPFSGSLQVFHTSPQLNQKAWKEFTPSIHEFHLFHSP